MWIVNRSVGRPVVGDAFDGALHPGVRVRGASAHPEAPAAEGYTPEGANAGDRSAVVKGDPASGHTA